MRADCPRYHASHARRAHQHARHWRGSLRRRRAARAAPRREVAMAEYDLVCDGCGKACEPADAAVSWTANAEAETAFALTHLAHVPAGAGERIEVRKLVWPNEYLRFVSARLGKRMADPEPLRAILWALAPFVMRHDN